MSSVVICCMNGGRGDGEKGREDPFFLLPFWVQNAHKLSGQENCVLGGWCRHCCSPSLIFAFKALEV